MGEDRLERSGEGAGWGEIAQVMERGLYSDPWGPWGQEA